MRYRSTLLIEKQYLIFNLSFDLVQIASEAAFPRNDRLVIKKASLKRDAQRQLGQRLQSRPRLK